MKTLGGGGGGGVLTLTVNSATYTGGMLTITTP